MAAPRGDTSGLALLAPIVNDMAIQLSSLGILSPGAATTLESRVNAFVLCYRRYGTPQVLFELISKGLPDSVLRIGYWRLLFAWVKLRFRSDFYVSNRNRRKLLHNLIDIVAKYQRPPSRSEDVFECNCIVLLLLRCAQVATAVFYESCVLTFFYQPYRRKSVSKLTRRMTMVSSTSSSSISDNNVIQQQQKLEPEKSFWTHLPREVAEQMTLIDANIFRAIRQEEFYNKGWTDSSRAPILHMLIGRSNSISLWVASSVLCQASDSARSRALARFVVIAQALEELGNYNSLASVLGGFKLWAINRLQKVIALRKNYRLILSYLDGLMSPDNNYRNYRAVLAAKQGKLFIPHLGLCLKDLTFIEDGNQDIVNGSPNLEKIYLFGSVLHDIERTQRTCTDYNKRIVSRYPALLEHLARLPRMTDEELNAASMALRPSNVEVSVDTSSSEDSTTKSSDDSESSDLNEMLLGGDIAVSRVLRFLPQQDTPRSSSAP